MPRFKVGVQLHPQATTTTALQRAWQAADGIGVDSIWVWDHFFPLYGDPDESHFECWALLAAMAVTTKRARFGAMVSCAGYRNPDLLADMARTVDHLSGGRLVLGLGAGWFARDYDAYGYEFGTAKTRLDTLEVGLERIRERLALLNPPPAGGLPLLIGGGGERRTLRLVAEHAQLWNGIGEPEVLRHKNAVIDAWCDKVGRDPAEIERTALVPPDADPEAYLDAGVTHLIVMTGAPFDLAPAQRLLDAAGA
jgi:probable F420-dependent oxidoreductase